MPRTLVTLFVVLFTMLGMARALPTSASEPPAGSSDNAQAVAPDEYSIGKVADITSEGFEDRGGITFEQQSLTILLTSGSEKGKIFPLKNAASPALPDYQRVSKGESVVIAKSQALEQTSYSIVDKYRLVPVLLILFVFFGLVVLFSRWKGAMSIVGLLISILVLAKFFVPRIIAGAQPLTVGLEAAFVIAVLSIYTAHGLSKRTSIALLSTLLTLSLSVLISMTFVHATKLFGLGTEDAFNLQVGPLEHLNLKGLLLAGIIIGALGVLDDVTTGQTAAVDEIAKANPRLDFSELWQRGLSVGREHIASLVNTLVLAYAGASLPLFLLFAVNRNQPLWVSLNSEFIAEELIRTLAGSIALVLAVPIATWFAAYFFSRSSSGKRNIPASAI